MSTLKIVFAGTPHFANPALRALISSSAEIVAVYTQPDKQQGRGRKLQFSPVKQLAIENGLIVKQPQSLKSAAVQAEFAELQPDLMVVVAYGLILPEKLLTIPRYGCLNVHASLLPRWRGAAPIERALLAGDSKTGVAIMQMAEGLDTGPVLCEKTVDIDSFTTASQLRASLAILGADLLLSCLDNYVQGKLTAKPQATAGITYANKIYKTDLHIDWQQSAEYISRQIRTFDQKPVCYTHCGDLQIKIWQAQFIDSATQQLPGTISQIASTGIDVVTGRGIIRVLQCQLPGGKPMAIADILRGHQSLFQVGMQFS